LKLPALVVHLVVEVVTFLYFFTKDLLTKVAPQPESNNIRALLWSLLFLPPFLLKIHPSVMEDKCLLLAFLVL
jgi:hypothetical protein